jgi:hypothetical protein
MTLQIDGHAAKAGKSGVFDATFKLANGLMPVSGEIKSAGGHAVYVRIPLLGHGWKRYVVPRSQAALRGPSVSKLDSAKTKAVGAKLQQLDPAAMLRNVLELSSGSTNTFSADVDPAKVVAAIETLASGQVRAARHTAQLRQIGAGVKVAHGSVSVDSTTHLPTAASVELQMDVPQTLRTKAQGVTGFDLKIDATFDSWNQAVHVTAPAQSSALQLNSSLLQGFAH